MSSGKKNFGKYYLGLDIGTNSVGWCVTDPNYNVLKKNGKAMLGIRLFDAAETAADRRSHRCDRRRLQRRRWRVKLVRNLLKSEIEKVDPHFFSRLDESRFLPKDKKGEFIKNTPDQYLRFNLFANSDSEDRACRTDKDFYREYPTIYHLRVALMEHCQKNDGRRYDIRLYYLVISHFMKHRGYFYQDLGESGSPDFESIFESFKSYASEEIGVDLNINSTEDVRNILCDKNLESKNKKKMIISLLDDPSETQKEVINAICGLKFNLKKLFNDNDEDLKENFSFENNSIDNLKIDRKYLECLNRLYELYRCSVFDRIKEGYKTISESQKARYDKCREILYNSKLNHEDNNLSKIPTMKRRSIPYRINFEDLKLVLKSLVKDYQVFGIKESDGYSVHDKIKSIFTFKIPYYIGPLNTYHSKVSGNSWMIRKEGEEKGRIYPWNFDKKVDQEKTAEAFLQRMLRNCQKLVGEKVIPKNSLLYSRYMVLNEINNIRIDGKKISPEDKQRIYFEIFKGEIWKELKSKKLTKKKLHSLLVDKRIIDKDSIISGVDEDIHSSLKSYHDFKDIIGLEVDNNPNMVETMIYDILVFGDNKNFLKKRIMKDCEGRLSDNQIERICKLSYSGWGSFSRKFLMGITENGRTIIDSLWEGNENLEELLGKKHGFQKAINEFNHIDDINQNESRFLDYKSMCKIADRFYPSPSVKRSIWQTIMIVNEIRKVFGEPSKVFIEFAREKEKNGKRTVSRKEQLLDLYNNLKNEEVENIEHINEFLQLIQKKAERDFNEKFYLYLLQNGRDIYTGETIPFEKLFSDTYDIDHIIPQSIKKDDSVLNNKVLTKSDFNRNVKGNCYPISCDVVTRCKSFWLSLKKNKFMTEEKYDRLTQKNLTSEEKIGFINRQLVETRQSTKLVKELIEYSIPNVKTICVRSSLISEFRRDNRLYNNGNNGFWKSRLVNDYHHAKDAYLNIVVGNVYSVLFSDPRRVVEENVPYSLKMSSIFGYRIKKDSIYYNSFNYELKQGNVLVWRGGESGSIDVVRKTVSKNNILFTRYANEKHGVFWDITQRKNHSNQNQKLRADIPLKTKDSRYDYKKYGGYKSLKINHFIFVESIDKKCRGRYILGVPTYLKDSTIDDQLTYVCNNNNLPLDSTKILIPKIKINSLLKYYGMPIHLSSMKGNYIGVKNAAQLVLKPEFEQTVYRIEHFINKKNGDKIINEERDKIDSSTIYFLFKQLQQKAESNVYSKRFVNNEGRRGRPKFLIFQNEDRFLKLRLEDQCKVVAEILNLFHCGSDLADMRLLGGPEGVGAFKIPTQLTLDSAKASSIKLVHQSVTGLFEQEIDLFKVGK